MGAVEPVRPVTEPGRPLVFAHRGASEDEPEHTLTAYLRALQDGVDGIECDVRLTADEHLVLVHDRRVNRTSSGRGVVSTLELDELEGLDWGTWRKVHPESDEEPDRDRHRILTLRRLLTAVTAMERPQRLLIETKHPTRYAGLVERHLAQLLTEFGLHEPGHSPHEAWMMSFSQLAVQRMRQMCPAVPGVFLIRDTVPLRFRDGSLPRGISRVGLDVRILRKWPRTVERQHWHGHRVYAWIVDEDEDVTLCLELGVDGILTNRPRSVMDRMDRFG
jgi:glycerophosphoryl diester phosphodiesterase